MKTSFYKMMFTLAMLLLMVKGQTLFAQTQGYTHIETVNANPRELDARFGNSCAIHGNYAIVGAPHEKSGINNPIDSFSNAGAAYIYEYTANGWTFMQRLVASNRAANDKFGQAVSIHGNYAIVGSPFHNNNQGMVYVFELSGGTWTETQQLQAGDADSGDEFGTSVSIRNNHLIVGAWYDEDANYNPNATQYTDEGSAYIFNLDANNMWVEQQKIIRYSSNLGIARTGSSKFGNSVDIDFPLLVVGAFEVDKTGFSNVGEAYVYRFNGNSWAMEAVVTASDLETNDRMGRSVAISGTTVAVAAHLQNYDATSLNGGSGNGLNSAGAVYMLSSPTPGTWTLDTKVTPQDRKANDQFGFHIDLSNNQLIVGARFADMDTLNANAVPNSGSAYLFKHQGGIWQEASKFVTPSPLRSNADQFGTAVAVENSTVLVGARFEDEDKNGQNTISAAGAAYFFEGNCSIVDNRSITTCDSSYNFYGASLNSSGNYSHTIAGLNGNCDTIINLDISFAYTAPIMMQTTICDTVYYFAGNYLHSSGTYYDTLSSSKGCDSVVVLDLVLNPPSSNLLVETACNSYDFFGTTYTSTGIYNHVINNGNSLGCDSTIVLDLTITTVDTNVVLNGNTLTANASNATYQWVDCDNNNSPINGATNQSFTPTAIGNYAVEITTNNCTQLSNCIPVSSITGLSSVASDAAFAAVPNPATTYVHITTSIPETVTFRMVNSCGMTVMLKTIQNNATIDIQDLSPGIYMINLIHGPQILTQKIIKQ